MLQRSLLLAALILSLTINADDEFNRQTEWSLEPDTVVNAQNPEKGLRPQMFTTQQMRSVGR